MMDILQTLWEILGSPVLQGLAAAAALIAAVFGLLSFFFPPFRSGLQQAGQAVLRSPYFHRFLIALVLFSAGAGFVLFTGFELPKIGGQSTWPPENGILATVQARGKLRCGVHGGLPRFSEITSDGQTVGFDADFCRVIAIAIFGEHESRVEFIPLGVKERFSAVEDGRVDVLMRNTTWTVGRDVTRNLDFGPPIFYDGQAFLVHNASGITELADLRDKRICVLPNTTTIQNLRAELEERGIKFTEVTEEGNGTPFKSNEDVFGAYVLKRCHAVTSDQSQLAARQVSLPNPQEYDFIYDDSSKAAVVSDKVLVISKEPLAPVFAEGDQQWREVITYALYATIRAAELDINRENIVSKQSAPEIPIRAFLGIYDPDIEQHIGESIGLSNDFALKIIERMGNYNEIYQRNLGDLIPKPGFNQVFSQGGLLFSPPFNHASPRLTLSGTP